MGSKEWLFYTQNQKNKMTPGYPNNKWGDQTKPKLNQVKDQPSKAMGWAQIVELATTRRNRGQQLKQLTQEFSKIMAVNLESFEWIWQCKQQAFTSKTIQTMDGATTMAMMAKRATINTREPSEGSWWTKFQCAMFFWENTWYTRVRPLCSC